LGTSCFAKQREDERKLNALHEAAKYSFPTAGVDRMLAQIERGYLE
jgi:hypothetical protein